MNTPIRVLNLFTIMNYGGAETMVMNYYRSIDRTKVQFDFMVHREEKGVYDDEIEALGGRIYRMPPLRPNNIPKYKKMLDEFFSKHREYSTIHAHMSERALYIFQSAKKNNVPNRICHAHSRPLGFEPKTIAMEYLKKRILPYTTHMFVCGEEAGKWLFGEKNRGKFIFLKNAVDAQKYSYNPSIRTEVRNELGLTKQLIIGHVGSFVFIKNHKFIISIFNEIKKSVDAKLVLVGDDNCHDGAEIHRLVQQMSLEEDVVFLGQRNDVYRILQSFDVFLLPSLYEGLSVASIEAQASGLLTYISDRVPDECKITDLVQTIPLDYSARNWAEIILQNVPYKRKDTCREIVDAGFDIVSNASWLQDFYLSIERGN